MPDREVVRCAKCSLNQYRTESGNCRKCGESLPQVAKVRVRFNLPARYKMVERDTWQGEVIREARRRAGLTQTELARAIGDHRSHIAKIEAGIHQARPKTLQRIAGALNVRLLDMFPADILAGFSGLPEDSKLKILRKCKEMLCETDTRTDTKTFHGGARPSA